MNFFYLQTKTSVWITKVIVLNTALMKEEVTGVAVGLGTHLKKMGGIARVRNFYRGWSSMKLTRKKKKTLKNGKTM